MGKSPLFSGPQDLLSCNDGESNMVSSDENAIPAAGQDQPVDGQPELGETISAPTDTGEPMTPQQLAEAKEYGHRQLSCDLADRAIDITFLSVATFLLARPLDEWFQADAGINALWLRVAAMFLLITVMHALISLPLSFYSGHLLEHKYGLSRQSLGRWVGRYLKRNLLTLAFGLLMTWGVFAIIWWTGSWWWLVAAGAFFVVSVVMGQLAPVLILPLFYKITRLEDETLGNRFRNLSAGTGLRIEGVYRMEMSAETAKANAMLAGLGRTRRVLLGDTLLDGFEPDEIEVIFAHEVGHHVHRHIWKLIIIGLGFSLAGFYVCDWVVAGWVGQIEGSVDYHHFPAYALPALTLTITLFSQLLEPIQNVISRFFERQCDWYALQRTGMVRQYRSAFEKLARLNKSDPSPHPLEVFLFHSHPPIAERLSMADRL